MKCAARLGVRGGKPDDMGGAHDGGAGGYQGAHSVASDDGEAEDNQFPDAEH